MSRHFVAAARLSCLTRVTLFENLITVDCACCVAAQKRLRQAVRSSFWVFKMELQMIEQLEAQASLQRNTTTEAVARVRVTSDHGGNLVEVLLRRMRTVEQVFGYSYAGIRLERWVLLLLTCPEAACERSPATQRKWRELQGQRPSRSRRINQTVQFAHLVEDVAVKAGSRACVARPASFQCLTPCPVKAHAPIVMRKTGWDLFEGGKCVAGGLIPSPTTAVLEPMFPTTSVAHAWLAARPCTVLST